MAHKRAFSKTIIDTDAFQDMSQTAQLLYFYLNMSADDDGFVSNPKRIMRAGGFAEDDFKILLAKRFLLSFESGVVVIKHWLIHNTIRIDRYTETSYLEEKRMLKIGGNKAYTEKWQPNGNQLATQDKIREDKTREDKIKEDKIFSEQSSQRINPLIKLFEPINPSYERLYKNKTQRAALERLLKKYGEENVSGLIKYLKIMNTDRYAKGKSITPVEMENNLAHINNHYKQKVNSKPKIAVIPS
jgi:hypothetical protein